MEFHTCFEGGKKKRKKKETLKGERKKQADIERCRRKGKGEGKKIRLSRVFVSFDLEPSGYVSPAML